MSTLYYNYLEIEFADEKSKQDFKRLTKTTDIGEGTFLDFEIVFPLPPQAKLDEKLAEEFTNIFWDGSGSIDDSGGAHLTEDGLTLKYSFETIYCPPLLFIKQLYFYYPKIKKIRLSYNSEDSTMFLNEEDGPCEIKNCEHDDCEWHFIEWEIVLDWSALPHPLFEGRETIKYLKNLFPNETDESIGKIYHRLIGEVSALDEFSHDVFGDARKQLDEQIENCGIVYLEMMANVGDYGMPKEKPKALKNKSAFKKFEKLLDSYWQTKVSAKITDPLWKPKKKKKKK